MHIFIKKIDITTCSHSYLTIKLNTYIHTRSCKFHSGNYPRCISGYYTEYTEVNDILGDLDEIEMEVISEMQVNELAEVKQVG